jgi:hypothetical protein
VVVLVVVVFGVSGCRDVGVLVGRRALGGRCGWQVLKGVKKRGRKYFEFARCHVGHTIDY